MSVTAPWVFEILQKRIIEIRHIFVLGADSIIVQSWKNPLQWVIPHQPIVDEQPNI